MSDQFSWGVIFRIEEYVISWSPLTERWVVYNGLVFETEKDTRKEAVLYVTKKKKIKEADIVLRYDELESPPVDTRSKMKNVEGVEDSGGGFPSMGDSLGGSSSSPSQELSSGDDKGLDLGDMS